MSDSGEKGPMYGPWIRVDRPRKRGQRCRIIRNPGKSRESEAKRKTWRDLMREKAEREKQKDRSESPTDRSTKEDNREREVD